VSNTLAYFGASVSTKTLNDIGLEMMKKKRMRILKFETEKSALSTRKTFFFFLE
jgi:hypothetical protein